jgi:hypothetical protein
MTIDDLLALEEIRNLRIGYAAYMDSLDADALAALFTEDAVCEFGSYGTWAGRPTIHDNYKSVMAQIVRPRDVMHIVTNPWVQLTGPDTARGRWYLIEMLPTQHPETGLTAPGGSSNPLFYLGLYEDAYRKTDGRWLIARVKLHFLWPQRSGDAV